MEAVVTIYIIGVVVAFMQLNGSGHNDPLIGAFLWPITLLGSLTISSPAESQVASEDATSRSTPIGTTDDFVEAETDDESPPPQKPRGPRDEPPKPRF